MTDLAGTRQGGSDGAAWLRRPRPGDPAGTAPGGTAPAGIAPGGTAPGGTAPGGTAPGGTAPGAAATAGTAGHPAWSGSPAPTQTREPTRAVDLLPSVSLPKSGGAIRGLDEKFSVNAATGTGSMSIKLPFSPGRSGGTPALQLGYDSGSGNGPLGFGWSLGVPAITRKTDKGLPRYCDADESDVFILAGADDLVPVLDQAGARKTITRTVHGAPVQIAFYRPRIEGTVQPDRAVDRCRHRPGALADRVP